MKNKIITIISVILCFVLAACSNEPELLNPLGFDENSMVVKRGDMFNIMKTDNVVMMDVVDLSVKSNAIIKNVNVALGDEVKAGDVLVELDGASIAERAAEIDRQIASMEKDNAYVNSVKETQINIAELEYDLLVNNGASEEELNAKRTEITSMQNSLYETKLNQEKELSELLLTKIEGGNVDSELVAPCDGVVMYLSNWNAEETIEEGTVVAIIGKKGTKMILGDYLEEAYVESCDEYYALINGKAYDITNSPIDPNQIAMIDVFGGILQNTYYINEDSDEIEYGDIASVIFIKDKKENVLYIPDEGIYQDIDGYYVYVKNENGEKIRRDVEVGTIWDTAVEIVNGLEEGETIYGK